MCVQVNRSFGTHDPSELIPNGQILCKCNHTGKWYQTDGFNLFLCHSKQPKWFAQAFTNSPDVTVLFDAIPQSWWRKVQTKLMINPLCTVILTVLCVLGVCVNRRDAPVECLRTRSEPLRTEALRSPRDFDDLISLCLSWPLTWRNCGEMMDIYKEFC